MSSRIFGHIQGVEIGASFEGREALSKSGIHRPTQAGISGSQLEGADSIVVSGGYEDDEDFGDEIIYTGHGGNDPNTKKQIADQKFTRGNKALAVSSDQGLPVRVIRGAHRSSAFAPEAGLRYDGLYYVDEYWADTGKAGFLIWRFRLCAQETHPLPVKDDAPALPARVATEIQRIVRSTENSRHVKELHDYTCQVCGIRLETPSGPYAEAAHIRPLGRPHNGPDTVDNILCLCPNHHVLFDRLMFTIEDDLRLRGSLEGSLRVSKGHYVGLNHVAYHRGLRDHVKD